MTKGKPWSEWWEEYQGKSCSAHLGGAAELIAEDAFNAGVKYGMEGSWLNYRMDLATQNALEVAAGLCDERVERFLNGSIRKVEAEACAAAIRAKKVK